MKTSPHPPMFRRALALLLCCLVAASCWALPASAQETENSPAKETTEEPAVLDEDARQRPGDRALSRSHPGDYRRTCRPGRRRPEGEP